MQSWRGGLRGTLSPVIRVADLELDEVSGDARYEGKRTRIRAKPLNLLGHLAQTPGRTVPKTELLEELWPDQVVSDAALTSAVREVRRALRGLGASSAIRIEAIRGLGYRLVTAAASATALDPDIESTLGRLGADGFFGRERELARLRAALDEVVAGRPRTILLEGTAGIGKTRLVAQLASQEAARDLDVLWGRCHEGPQPPLWPWAEILRAFCQSRPPAAAAPVLRPVASELGRVLPTVRALFDDVDASLEEREPEVARLSLLDGFVTFVDRMTRQRPSLLVIDDLQWADPSSLLLFSTLAARETASRMLLVGLYRGDEIQPMHALSGALGELQGNPQADVLTLAPLTDDESRAFVGGLPDSGAWSPHLEEVLRIANGNPFFLEQLVGNVRETRDHGSLPEGVERLVLRKLGQRSETARRLLSQAAVVGIQADVSLWRAVAGLDDATFRDGLDELRGAALIELEPDRMGTEAFRFDSAVVHRVAYLQTPAGERAALHLAIAEELEAESEPEGERLAELAHHFDLASEICSPSRAFHYRKLAGADAHRRRAFDEAVQHFSRADTLFEAVVAEERRPNGHGRDAEHCDLLLALSRAAREAGDDTTAARASERALGLRREAG